MSTTCYYEAVRPTEPLGSWSQLKWMLFDEGDRINGRERLVSHGDWTHTYLRGYYDALAGDDDRKADLKLFLDALETHRQLRVWIDE